MECKRTRSLALVRSGLETVDFARFADVRLHQEPDEEQIG